MNRRRIPLEFTPDGLVLAYRHGVFPMAMQDPREIGWFRPDPRAIIPLNRFHVSRSLRKTLRSGKFEIRYDTDFLGVMNGCANRPEGTWISDDFLELYGKLHLRGIAHSAEAWMGDVLVGGTYGLAIGGAFMAESMFHSETDASKVALFGLVTRLLETGFKLLDVQYLTPHLESLGAIEVSCANYLAALATVADLDVSFSR